MPLSRRSFLQQTAAAIGASFAPAALFPASRGLSPSGAASLPHPGIPRMVCQDFSRPFDPAYLSNGLVGIRPRPVPLARATTIASGFVGSDARYEVEALAPAPDPLETDVTVNGVSLLKHPEAVRVRQQALDMATGELTTSLAFTASGVTLELEVLQFAARSVPSLLCQEVTMAASTRAAIEVTARIEVEPASGVVYANQPPEQTEVDLVVGVASRGNLSKLGAAASVIPDPAFLAASQPAVTSSSVSRDYQLEAKPGVRYRFRTIAAMVSEFYHPAPHLEAIRLAKWGAELGFDLLRQQNRDHWRELWKSRILVSGDTDSQRVLDAAFFYLHSSLHPSNRTGMGPFGLSQAAYYYGHSFWDTESWCLLPVILASPSTARSLLEYRLRGLPAARRLASLYGYRGAQFPWEAGQLDGSDATPTFASTGWEEQHITPDVALGFWEYQLASGDPQFLKEATWPVLRAVAEWIESRGIYTSRGFEIQHIMGPDESVPDTNNNSYMNLICKMVLRAAVRCAAMAGAAAPDSWTKIADSFVIPIDVRRHVVLPYDRPPAPRDQAYSLLNLDCLTVHDPPLHTDLFRNTYELEKELRRSRPAGIGFATAALAATAAFFGDRHEAAQWFRESWQDVWLEPYGMIREAPSQDYGCFLTNFGSLLQTALLGFTGLRMSEGAWNKYPARLPEGWTKIEIERIWVRGAPKHVLAEHGQPAQLFD